MHSKTVIIVDDEQLARDSIKVLLNKRQEWRIVAEANNGLEAIKLITQLKPDLLFLDINMPLVSGLEVISRLTYRPHIIFTTAYDVYAIKAFEENAIDYLLKPYSDNRFFDALSRVDTKIREKESTEKIESIFQLLRQGKARINEQKIAVNANNRIVLLDISSILWVNASGNYVELCTGKEKYLHYESMNNMEQMLRPPDFLRIHRSHIVRCNQIKALKKHTNGEYFVVLNNNVELKLSRSHKDKVSIITGNA